ncbi:MAG: hypothetical protein J7J38_03420 [Candidatus Aenigmarchaeota archaeon]|nr:hypothetical protein [Candidatus Aenigmarchaeota archaeon]
MPAEVRPTKAFVFIDGNNFYHNVKLMKIKPSYIDFYKLSEYASILIVFIKNLYITTLFQALKMEKECIILI